MYLILGRIHLIRYEDMSVDPFGTTDKLLKFLDFSPSNLIEKFVEGHTKTTRNSAISAENSNFLWFGRILVRCAAKNITFF